MKTLSIDIETYSSADLVKCGVYKYVDSDDFEILLFAYAIDGKEVQVIDLAQGENLPDEVLSALRDNSVIKWAFNANFERVCISKWLGFTVGNYLSPESWRCSMVWAATLGLPQSLAEVGSVLGLEKQKLTEGKELIKYFCVPCTPTNTNGMRTRNLPIHAPEKWELFKRYNKRDVETEIGIQQRLSRFPVSDSIWAEYHLDQRINDRGISIDMDLVHSAITIDGISRDRLVRELRDVTSLENPNSAEQMKRWLAENGLSTDTLGKKEVAAMLKTAPTELARVLTLRQRLAKSSVKKYTAMKNAVCSDNRARGMFKFYGANRTGRFAGKIIQLQNLPQNHLPDLEEARSLVKLGDIAALDMLYEDIPDTLSQLIRTAFVPKDGCKFIVADFSAIEARVLAWLAGEQWVLDTFASGGDIYCATAQRMFHCKVEKHGENAHLRQKGKQATLSCGYGGSVGALIAMGALESGMTEDELQPLVDAWREANPNIVLLWRNVDMAVKRAVKERSTVNCCGMSFSYRSGMLFITLPSGRKLAYTKPRIGENRFGGESVTYEGIGQNKKWERLESYGAKFVENITQATSRDILCFAMKNLTDYGCRIVAHIHDECVIEAPIDMKVETVCNIMGQVPPWAKGLLLRAEGYECNFYKKD